MMRQATRRQRGVALPVMLIILVVMLVSSIYLLKSSNSTTLTTANLAYDASLSRAADLGLHTAFQWLSTTGKNNKAVLNADNKDNGYLATLDTTQAPAAAGFWVGSQKLTDGAGNSIEYVVHRLCKLNGPYDAPGNACVKTTQPSSLGTTVKVGDSIGMDSAVYNSSPQVHYVITSRISGPRGGNVVNQMVVLIGA